MKEVIILVLLIFSINLFGIGGIDFGATKEEVKSYNAHLSLLKEETNSLLFVSAEGKGVEVYYFVFDRLYECDFIKYFKDIFISLNYFDLLISRMLTSNKIKKTEEIYSNIVKKKKRGDVIIYAGLISAGLYEKRVHFIDTNILMVTIKKSEKQGFVSQVTVKYKAKWMDTIEKLKEGGLIK